MCGWGAQARIPTLYGSPETPAGAAAVLLPEAECLPPGGPPVLNNTAHAAGPRKYDSGDTGGRLQPSLPNP